MDEELRACERCGTPFKSENFKRSSDGMRCVYCEVCDEKFFFTEDLFGVLKEAGEKDGVAVTLRKCAPGAQPLLSRGSSVTK